MFVHFTISPQPPWSKSPPLFAQTNTTSPKLFYPSTLASLFLSVIMSFSSRNFSCSWEKTTFLSAYYMPGIMLDSRNSTIRKWTSSSFSVSQKALTNLKSEAWLSFQNHCLSSKHTSFVREVHFSAHWEFVVPYNKRIYEVCTYIHTHTPNPIAINARVSRLFT